MRIFITGATGYIGERLVLKTRAAGHAVIAGTRRAPTDGCDWIPFEIGGNEEILLPADVTSVIHLAANTELARLAPADEINAARRLIAAANRVNAAFVFVSSQAAREDAPTAYGRTKWQIEQIVTEAGGQIIRPGQVYGGPERGLFGVLCAVTRKLPVLPGFLPSPLIQPVHVDDLADALLRCVATPLPPSVLCIGASEPVAFTKFLKAIGHGRLARYRLFLPVPVALVRLAAKVLGARAGNSGLDRLTSLFDLPGMQSARDLATLGLTLRPLEIGMSRSGKVRRALLGEGHALLRYVLRDRPSAGTCRHYARVMEQMRDGAPLPLLQSIRYLPFLVALVDTPGVPRSGYDAELRWRINAATLLAEASIPGAQRFLALNSPPGPLRSLVGIGKAVAGEAWWRLLRLVVRPLFRKLYRMRDPLS